jgi:hypothetical protein
LSSSRDSGDLLPASYDDWVLDERAKLRVETSGAFMWLTKETPKRDDHKPQSGSPNASSTWSRPRRPPFRFRWKHISPLATEPRRYALTTGSRRCSSASLRWHPERRSGACINGLGLSHSITTKYTAKCGARTWHRSPNRLSWGRALELNQLNDAWNIARKGRAHLVLVTGEPGIGRPVSRRNSPHVRASIAPAGDQREDRRKTLWYPFRCPFF